MNSQPIAIAALFAMVKNAVSGMVITSDRLLMSMGHFTNLFRLPDIFAKEKENPNQVTGHFRYYPCSCPLTKSGQ